MLTSWEGMGSSMERGTEGMAASWNTTAAPRMSGRNFLVIADIGALEIDGGAHLLEVGFRNRSAGCR